MARVGWTTAERVLLGVVLTVIVVVPVAVVRFDIGPRQFTGATVVVAIALFVGSIALPAVLLSRWQRIDA